MKKIILTIMLMVLTVCAVSAMGSWDDAAARVSAEGGDWGVLIGQEQHGTPIVNLLGDRLRSDIPWVHQGTRLEEFLDYLWGAGWRQEEIARRGSLRSMQDYRDQLIQQVNLMVAEPTAARLEWGHRVHIAIRNSQLRDARW